VPIRVPVREFTPGRSQRRVIARNRDVTVDAVEAAYAEEDFALYRKYSLAWHGKEVSGEDYTEFLVNSPVDTIAFRYRDGEGRLLAVGVCDVCELSVSSVYFFFDPAEAKRSLGTLGVIREIEWAAARRIPHYYLGYWIAGSPAMSYKNRFRPYDLLGGDGSWRRAGTDD
jgi:arginine-tRNA-protein transferase